MGLEAGWTTRTVWEPGIRIANPPPSLLSKYTAKEKTFFYDYADFVLKIIQHELVQQRLRLIIETEALRVEKLVDVRVMVFPARPLRGRTNRVLHGSYSHSASQISLYPLKLPRYWIRQEGLELFKTPFSSLSQRGQKLLYEMSETAIATLVHEILHVKFEHRGMSSYVEEAVVRKIEKMHMEGWEQLITATIERVSAKTSLSSA